MKTKLILFFISTAIFGSSCNNDDDANENILSGYERIVDKNFSIRDVEVRANGVILNDRSVVFDCERDNIYRYESSGTAVTRYGLLKCDPNEPVEEIYFWTLITNDSKLILDYNGPNVLVYNILLNDGRNLVLERFSIEDVDGDGTLESVQSRFTYVRS